MNARHPAAVLDSILDTVIDGRFKGFAAVQPTRIGDVAARRWNLLAGDVGMPMAVLRQAALDHNLAWMRDFTLAFGVDIAPHGKTTMAPQLFARQIEAGAWGMTVATATQLGIALEFGLRRIVLANQPIDPASLRTVAGAVVRHPDLELLCLADSVAGVERLAAAMAEAGAGRPIGVLVEVGIPGGRTGCRTVAAARAIAQAVGRSRGRVALRGVECFEGIIGSGDAAADAREVGAFVDRVVETARDLVACDAFAPGPVVLSAGGSAFFDLAARRLGHAEIGRPVHMLLRSGCYLTHDSRFYERLVEAALDRLPAEWRARGGLKPALEVWGCVQSCPEPGLAFLNFGKRDVSYDIDLPMPLWLARDGRRRPAPDGLKVTKLNDQHAYLAVPEGTDIAVGDLVGCGISHPCTTFDKWPLVAVVDEDDGIVDAVRTFF